MKTTKENKGVLAFEYSGADLGREYFLNDFQTSLQIEMIFDLAQVRQVYITNLGWNILFVEFGIKALYKIDCDSGWFDTDNEQEWIENIIYTSLCCGYNPIDNTVGQWNENQNIFKTKISTTKIDWSSIHKMTIANNI